MLMRALLALLALPGVTAFAIPLFLVRPPDHPFRLIGVVPVAAGVALLIWCIREFAVSGKGTLAPWDPPRHLVSSGPYRVSRNPMYLAVSVILLGWAIGFVSRALLLYALMMMAIFHLAVLVYEEPYNARVHRRDWPQFKTLVPRWIFRSRRAVVVAWFVVLVSLPIAGLIYEAIADGVAQKEFAAPGTMVDIGGRRLHMICIGDGEPVVIFEHSGWGSSLSSARARELVATRTKVCSYDRSGHGWSDPGPGITSSAALARDLAVLQDRAKLRSPFVIVSSSIGGLTAEMFARQYPERVVGLVFLDAASSPLLVRRASAAPWARVAFCGPAFLGQFGVIRLLDPFGIGTATDEARRGSAITYNPRPWWQLCAMARGFDESAGEFAKAPPLRSDLPLTVLTASSAATLLPPPARRFVDLERLHADAVDSHQTLAKRSTRGTWAIVPDSEHLIGGSNPEMVADVVIEMVEALK